MIRRIVTSPRAGRPARIGALFAHGEIAYRHIRSAAHGGWAANTERHGA